MAGLTTYGDENLVITKEKAVWYEWQRVNQRLDWSDNQGAVTITGWYKWYARFVRHCTMTFKYVGMEHGYANACKWQLETLYNRYALHSVWEPTSQGYFYEDSDYQEIPMAKIRIVPSSGGSDWYEGGLYDVVVEVNEVDYRDRAESQMHEQLDWSHENGRTYFL